MPAGSFHFSLSVLTVLSQGNCRFGLFLVPCLRSGFPSRVGHGSAAAQRSGASSALPGATGLTHIKLGFWQVANPLISSEALEVRGEGFNPQTFLFSGGFD